MMGQKIHWTGNMNPMVEKMPKNRLNATKSVVLNQLLTFKKDKIGIFDGNTYDLASPFLF